MTLPAFKYHPDPLDTGSVIASGLVCMCCRQARGYVYVGPVFAIEDYQGRLCPWCIADGSAHASLGASFTDEHGIGDGGAWGEVPAAVVEEVAFRTPGFSGWQQERWWTHCGDAAQFLGRAGRDELQAFGPQALTAIRDDAGLADGPAWERFLAALSKHGSPTAYLFRCIRCGALGGYQDCD